MKQLVEGWDYEEFKRRFYQKMGLELDRYKDKQMERRIRQLMQREGKATFNELMQYILEDEKFKEKFMNYLTINTSEFFRDGKVFASLQGEILPRLLHSFQSLFIWSAGCSIGAESYSIAILLDQLRALHRARIVATDIDEKALSIARKGVYQEKLLGKTGPHLINKYFTKNKEGLAISEKLRKAVDFRSHNLFVDPVPGRCHLILCRNVFIYFKADTQAFLLEKFSSNLEQGGFLVIGSAEYISNPGRYRLKKLYPTIYEKL